MLMINSSAGTEWRIHYFIEQKKGHLSDLSSDQDDVLTFFMLKKNIW